MKKSIPLAVALSIAVQAMPMCLTSVSAWEGNADTSWYTSEAEVYYISDADDLAGFAELVNGGTTFQDKTVYLENDIVLNEGTVKFENSIYSFELSDGGVPVEWTPVGVQTSSKPKGFRGTFDGKNHTVSGMYISSDESYKGFFGVTYGCTIKNLKIDNSLIKVSGGQTAGGIIGGIPANLSSSAQLNIEYCESGVTVVTDGEVTQNTYVGGVVGSSKTNVPSRNAVVNVNDSGFDGIIALKGASTYAGGIISEPGKTINITSAFNSGSISAATAGGIVSGALATTSITASYNSGSVSGTNAGGIVAKSSVSPAIKYCYNRGIVSGDISGAIITSVSSDENLVCNYYLSESADNAYLLNGEAVTDSEGKVSGVSASKLKEKAVLDILNTENAYYELPGNEDNDGFPVSRNLYLRNKYAGKYTASNAVISGTGKVGTSLTANFDFEGPQDILNTVKYAWKMSDSEDDGYVTIGGQNTKNLPVELSLHNKYVIAEITLPLGEVLKSEPYHLFLYDASYTRTIDSCAIRGIYSTGNTLHFTYESSDGVEDKDISCEWFKSATSGGVFESVGTGFKYVVPASTDTEYYYASVILPNGVTHKTETIEVQGYNANNAYFPDVMTDVGAWTRDEAGTVELEWEYTATGLKNAGSNKILAGIRAYSNEDYTFSVDGHKFVLVDTIETSDTARFKVIADYSYGREKIDEIGLANVASRLPEKITKHIDNTVWHDGSVGPHAGMYNGAGHGGVYPFSPNEMKEAIDKVGIISFNYETKEPTEYIMRAASKSRSNGIYMYVMKSYDIESDVVTWRINGSNYSNETANYAEVRPVLYLDKDFFKTEKIDTDAIGSEVFNIIKNTYSKDELSDIYPESVLYDVFGYKGDYQINSVNAVNSADNCNVTVSVTDNSATKDAYLLVTLYNNEEQMQACVFTDVSASLNGTNSFNVSFGKAAESGSVIRCILVDKAGTMSTFGKEFAYEVE